MFNQLRSFLFFSLLIIILIVAQKNVLAQERKFLDIELEFLDQYELTQQSYQDTVIGGFSGITYNQQKNVYYVISDDRSQFSPARFYTLKINFNKDKNQPKIDDVTIEKVTLLKDKQGKYYPEKTIDTEGIALTPRNSLIISSEGVNNLNIPPFINEFDLDGNLLQSIRIPERYIYSKEEQKGVQDNLGLEALTIKANGIMPQDPFRVFASTELALNQDIDENNPETQLNSRLLHYVVNPIGQPILVAEHLYPVDKPNVGVLYNGITELLALPEEGYLLSLERTFGVNGHGAKIFQIVMGNATDISREKTLLNRGDSIVPIQKKLLLNLKDLNIQLDNLEGMTFGSILPDGSRSLILVSDNNFSPERGQKNQFLLFKIKSNITKNTF